MGTDSKRETPEAASHGFFGGRVAVLAGAALAVAVVLVSTTAAAAAPAEARSDTSWVEVTAESPPAVRLVFKDVRSLRVPEVVVERYTEVLRSLSMTCRIGERSMARVADAAVAWLNERADREFERIQFLSTFDESLGAARKSAPDCRTQARSVLLGMAEETNLRDMEINALESMLRTTWHGTGSG